MIDGKEYAKQMRENAVIDDNGIVKVSEELWHQIADVIEELQAEIARLKYEHEKTTVYCANLFDKYEKTKIAKESLENTRYTARADAIKEFVQELKDRTAFYSTAGTSSFIEGCIETKEWYDTKIDEIAKEMAGAGDGENGGV